MSTSPHNSSNSGGAGGRLREPPAARFAADELIFDLRKEVESLKSEHGPSSAGHRQKTLYKQGRATVALFRFERDGRLDTHKAAGTVTIHVIDGRLAVHAAGQQHILAADQLLVLAPNVGHDVHALEESTMLLQVHLDPDS